MPLVFRYLNIDRHRAFYADPTRQPTIPGDPRAGVQPGYTGRGLTRGRGAGRGDLDVT